MEFNNESQGEELSQQAVAHGKQAVDKAGDVAKGIFRKVKEGGKQAGRGISKGIGKGIAHAAAAIGNTIASAITAIIAALPVILIVIVVLLILILVFSASMDWLKDERGSSTRLDLTTENPVQQTEEGYLKALALTEPQALMDAYYRYMACNSHQKIYLDSNGNPIWLEFSNANETADFASLMDYFGNEEKFYLSPYFIKMADELLHDGEFYFPEQIIKPVYSALLPLDSAHADSSNPNKKYITALPVTDDGSANAKALMNGTDLYAIGESLKSTTDEPLKRTIEGTGALLAQSKAYNADNTAQTTTDIPGIWDYGFGSVLQYEPMEIEKYIQCTKISFNYHMHIQRTYYPEPDPTPTPTATPSASPSASDAPEVSTEPTTPPTPVPTPAPIITTYCGPSPTHTIDLETDTISSIINFLDEECNKYEAYLNENAAHNTEYSVWLEAWPEEEITKILGAKASYIDHVNMDIDGEDEQYATRVFDNSTLQSVFGNGDPATNARATQYPLKVSVLSSAATFSGNIRFTYRSENTPSPLLDRTAPEGDLSANWNDNYTKFTYATSCSNFSGLITRAGTINKIGPVLDQEITVPFGFNYLEAYDSYYDVYVPDVVKMDNDFQTRVRTPQSGAYDANLDANFDGTLTILDFLMNMGLLRPYYGGTLGSVGQQSTIANLSEEDKANMQKAGCSLDAEGEVLLLAKLIASEAGPNKLDQLMVGAVAYNRVKSPYFAQNTLIGVITAPGQYSSWPGMVCARTPTEEMIESARQVLDGTFAIPDNVVFQAGFLQGDGTYLTNVNGAGYNTHYYCYKGSSVSNRDAFGRSPAPSSAEVKALAESLKTTDLSHRVAGSAAVGSTDTEGLYQNQALQLSSIMERMRKVADRTDVGFLDSLFAHVGNAFANILEQIKAMQGAFTQAFGDNFTSVKYYVPYRNIVPADDMHDTVIQAVTFINQDTYENIAPTIDTELLQFIFVGDQAGLGSSTFDMLGKWVAGTGSVFEGFRSPTLSYFEPTESWSPLTGNIVLAAPENTSVYMIADGMVTEIEKNADGMYTVTMEVITEDNKKLTLIYGNLFEVNTLSLSTKTTKGTKIGKVGKAGLSFTVLIDGASVDPMSYFYQPTYSAGTGFTNLLDGAGNIDTTLVNMLREELNAANSNITYNYDIYHTSEANGGKSHQSVGECTWWAYGRGLQYCEQMNTIPASGFKRGYGNGKDYVPIGSTQWQSGKIPQAGAWISWDDGTYGHVAFVEAVGADGSIVISQSGQGYWKNHDGKGINVSIIKNTGTQTNPYYAYGGYRFVGFVYLDKPLA